MSSKSTYKIEYYLLLIIQSIFSILPRWFTLFIGTVVGEILRIQGAYRKTIYGNMRYAGFWSEDEMEKIAHALYRNMGRYMSDFIRFDSKAPPYRVHNFDIVERINKQEKKGMIALLAHIGNWELLAQIFGKKVYNLNVIAKPMKNSIVDNWLAQKRASTGVTTIYTQHALRKMFEALKKNEIVAILIDQHAGPHGTMIPFLGKDANTVRTAAGMVHKTGCAVVPAFSIMQKDGSYDIYISEALPPDLTGKNDDQCIEAYQRQHNEIISEWIKKYPEHYFGWFHKRFRHIIPYK